jgi:hypothetical protein
MKLTKRVAGFVWKHAQYIPAEKLRLGGPGAARTDFSPKQRFIESRRLLTMRRVRSDDASPRDVEKVGFSRRAGTTSRRPGVQLLATDRMIDRKAPK